MGFARNVLSGLVLCVCVDDIVCSWLQSTATFARDVARGFFGWLILPGHEVLQAMSFPTGFVVLGVVPQ